MLLKKGSKGVEVKQLQQMLGLTADGDFGPKTEEAVKQWQKDHGLTIDGIVGDKTWATVMSGSGANANAIEGANYSPLSNHITLVSEKQNKYIVVHYTAGGSSKPGSALGVKKVFSQRAASADFVVDDGGYVQLNPNLNKYGTWHCGDKKYPLSKGGSLYGKCTNRNSIGIEVCSNLAKGASSAVPNHAGWSYTEASLNNLVKLVKILMKQFNIDKDHVIRHYDVSGKVCPGIPGWNDEMLYDIHGNKTKERNNSEEWKKFKERL